MQSSRSVTVRAHAKINLELRVGGPRSDGFHSLATVFHAVGLSDDITVQPLDDQEQTRASDQIPVRVSVDGPFAARVPVDDSNLVVKAARLLAKKTNTHQGIGVHITKHIPIAGGLAGGSADAAGTLVACDALWGTKVPKLSLHQWAAQLGSDVPFALMGGTAIGAGRGELLTAAMVTGQFHWVIAVSREGLSTPQVFTALDGLRAGGVQLVPLVNEHLLQALRSGDPMFLAAHMGNDMQPAALALQPPIAATIHCGEQAGALKAMVSGSGPSVVFLAPSAEASQKIVDAVAKLDHVSHAVAVTGPAPGPRVLVRPQSL